MCPTGTCHVHDNTTTTTTTTSSSWNNNNNNLRLAFDVLDVDHDGKISREDLQTFYGGFGSVDVDGDDADADDVIGSMISMADSNKDGLVEYDEFEKVILLQAGPGKKNKKSIMVDVFMAMDKDGDGKVGVEDLKAYLASAGVAATHDDAISMITFAGGAAGGISFDAFLEVFLALP